MLKRTAVLNCLECSKSFEVPVCRVKVGRKFCSWACKNKSIGNILRGNPRLSTFPMRGKRHTKETKDKIRLSAVGREMPLETRLKISKAISKENHYNWKGGISPQRRPWHFGYKKFRLDALKKNPMCTFCGGRERLEVDHIKPVSLFPELVMDAQNVRVLCRSCHKQTPSYGWKGVRLVAKLKKENT